MPVVWKAVCEDISMAAGGPMGSPVEHVFTRYFHRQEAAKKACESHCKKHDGKAVVWQRLGTTRFRSVDHGGAHQYTIETLNIE